MGVDAVRSGPVPPDGSSEPQAASAVVRASARTILNRVENVSALFLMALLLSGAFERGSGVQTG